MLEVGTVHIEVGNENLFTAENFQLPKAGVLLLLGPNGSGKTTFFKMLGRLLIERHLFSRSEVGHISAMSAYDRSIPIQGKNFVDLYSTHSKWPAEFETSFGHLKTKSIRDMSSGEFQALLLISQLSSKKKFYLFDEPFSHLNPAWTQVFVEHIEREAAQATFLIICHHIENFKTINVQRLMIHDRLLEIL